MKISGLPFMDHPLALVHSKRSICARDVDIGLSIPAPFHKVT